MARKSGGTFGKLVLLGVGALIGAAMTQKKEGQTGTSSTQAGNLKDSVVKGLGRLNEQSGGMVDKVKPSVNKAIEAVKGAIESQQQMMDKEKDALDKANQTLKDNVGSSTGTDSTGTGSSGPGMTSSDKAGSGTSGTASGSSSSTAGSASSGTTPSGGTFGGSTTYSESLKKNVDKDKSKNN
ncbi:MAG TPA: hypothetical protein VLQ20_12275 [Planococcus sp. (in: firmicutes)]|nr:hypothetical protein [Planococcus sp. (in: firmicutes)]